MFCGGWWHTSRGFGLDMLSIWNFTPDGCILEANLFAWKHAAAFGEAFNRVLFPGGSASPRLIGAGDGTVLFPLKHGTGTQPLAFLVTAEMCP